MKRELHGPRLWVNRHRGASLPGLVRLVLVGLVVLGGVSAGQYAESKSYATGEYSHGSISKCDRLPPYVRRPPEGPHARMALDSRSEGVPIFNAPWGPQGGHIPVIFGGANHGTYPNLTADVAADPPAHRIDRVWAGPNPFVGSTVIHFLLTRHEKGEVRIYDLHGRLVRSIDYGSQPAGSQSVTWDGRGVEGETLAAGLYFYRVTAGDCSVVRKLILLK